MFSLRAYTKYLSSFGFKLFFSSRERGDRLQTEDNAHELNTQEDLKRPLTVGEEALTSNRNRRAVYRE
jgi:hypothetical protein